MTYYPLNRRKGEGQGLGIICLLEMVVRSMKASMVIRDSGKIGTFEGSGRIIDTGNKELVVGRRICGGIREKLWKKC